MKNRIYAFIKWFGGSVIVGIVIGYLAVSGLFQRWEPVPLPQNAIAVDLYLGEVDSMPSRIISTAQDGRQYVYSAYPYDTEKDVVSDWRIIQIFTSFRVGPVDWQPFESNDLMSNFCDPDFPYRRIMRPPPGQVIREVRCFSTISLSSSFYRIVLLSNGELWMWNIEGPLISLLRNFTIVVSFSVIGFILGGIRAKSYQLPDLSKIEKAP
ncbi:MAG: hypothetical protein AAF490_07240 [Chloroflexota bacterium]